VPKKAVAIFFFSAFIGAVIFVYFTFPRTKDQIPESNNQRPFPSAPEPTPNGIPVPEPAPRPNTPKVPPGPTLRVMAWASAAEAKELEAEADAFGATTGRRASLTIDSDLASYRRDLQQAVASDSPPDVCLVTARDFCGIDPVTDLVDATTPAAETASRATAALTVDGEIKAVPTEFSVDVLFYNPSFFDQAGIGYPGPHWNWDIMESDARALASLHLKNPSGQPIYPLELPADFDFWNILCTQAGHPALDADVWHLSDADTKDSQMRALDFIHEIFQELTVTAPLPKGGQPPGSFFAQQRSALLIAPSDLTALLPKFNYSFTLLPGDLARGSLARVNGWAVTAKSTEREAARALAGYLAWQPVHTGWTGVRPPADDSSPDAICHEALAQALLPRIEPKTAPLAQFLDGQINQLARSAQENTGTLYARIQTEYQSETATPESEASLSRAAAKPVPKVEGTALRGM
jgi:ABC-type glycerol-3-phosphate transport system substrate-binding protein